MQSGCVDDSYHVNMIINLLLRFPEIFTVSYNLPAQTCSLLFMIKARVKAEQLASLRRMLNESLEAYRFFKKKEHCPVQVNKKYYYGFTHLELCLADNYLSGEEIGLISRLIKDKYGHALISELRFEEIDTLDDSPGSWEEIFPAPYKHGPECAVQKLIAFREAGKVYVFNQ